VLWQNTINPNDVNDSGGVTTLDVLVTVNYINAHPDTIPPPRVRRTEVLLWITCSGLHARENSGQTKKNGLGVCSRNLLLSWRPRTSASEEQTGR
jgi:hypothetical protein